MRPRLLDLFSGAGGAGYGYKLAGFHVTGVDVVPQPRYAGDEFIQADAMEFPLDGFDAVHASPPCPSYANVTKWRGNQDDHPRLIEPIRERLEASGLPYVIENVITPEIRSDFMLCGSMFGLKVRRHRFFETNWSGLVLLDPCRHAPDDLPFEHKNERAYADALGCEWMTAREGRDAIPPAYTNFIGERLMSVVNAEGQVAA
jgi:hypothetical protein